MSVDVALYKFLTSRMHSPLGTGKWTLNRWRSVRGEIVPCSNGLHAAPVSSLLPFISDTLWRVEVAGDLVWHGEGIDRKIVTRKMRLVERIETWNARTARLFAADCAERALKHFEGRYPEDKRPREAIEVARRFANGEATQEELSYASSAASYASYAASASYATAAASYAASYAAYAACYAAYATTAASYATTATTAASYATAAAYATTAASYATTAASYVTTTASVAEREWQARHLAEMLGLASVAEVQP